MVELIIGIVVLAAGLGALLFVGARIFRFRRRNP